MSLENEANEARKEFLSALRWESGNQNTDECPVCGSGAWEEDEGFGYCCDCGFDLVTAFSFKVTFPNLELKQHDYGIPPNDQHFLGPPEPVDPRVLPPITNRDPGDEDDGRSFSPISPLPA